MYRAVTRQIEVTVEPNFLPERSSVDRSQYFWSYTIVITNTGPETVQLRTRHWIITDATGRKQEVRGEGVVGEQPVLGPGEDTQRTPDQMQTVMLSSINTCHVWAEDGPAVPVIRAGGFFDEPVTLTRRRRELGAG